MIETSAPAVLVPGALQRPPAGDDALVFDALAFLQTGAPANRIAGLIEAAGFRNARGRPIAHGDVQRTLGSLADRGCAVRDKNGLWSAPPGAGWERFREIVLDAQQRELWWSAWRRRQHDHRIGFAAPEKSIAAVVRIVVHCGRTWKAFAELNRSVGYNAYWHSAVCKAVVAPFDAALFDQLDPVLAMELASRPFTTNGGDDDAQVAPLIDWLLARIEAAPASVPQVLQFRAAEALLFRERFDALRAVAVRMPAPESEAFAAAADIAEGRYAEGAARFEAAWKALGVKANQRKNLLPQTLAWLYPMALLAQPGAANWIKARKFVVSEARSREANPFTFWGAWHCAIDQRLGDAPADPQRHEIPRPSFNPSALMHLHELMLAAWLHVELPEGAARERLDKHAAALEARCRAGGRHWLARQTRRAAAALLGTQPAAEDGAMPFFVGPARDRWREALAAIVALGAHAGAPARGIDGADRLVWTVRVDRHARIEAIEPLEQKAGVRGLGRPRDVALSALLKRTDLPAHDAALLRGVRREWDGPSIDAAVVAPALVRHPHVAWCDAPDRFIEVTEGLPCLEVMTRGEHIAFRVVDPVLGRQAVGSDANEAPIDERDGGRCPYADPHLRQARAQHASTMLIADGPGRARLVRLTPAQWRIAELVSHGWQVPVSAKDELDAALRVLAAHFQVASDAEAGVEVPASAVLHAELTPHGAGLALKVVAAPFGDFGPRLAPGTGRERVTTVHRGATLFTHRDLQAERARLVALTSSVDFLDDGVHAWELDDPEQALAVVEALGSQAPGIVAEWPKGKPLRIRPIGSSAVKLSVTTHGDWLDFDGEVAFDDGEVLRLRALLDLMQQPGAGRYVALRDGDFIALSDTLRQQLADLNAIALPHRQNQRVARAAALAWAAAHGDELALEGDADWRARAGAWAQAQARVFDVPPTLQAELRDYQLAGYRWLMRLAASGFGACLADDMGLGKTLMTLAVLLARAEGGPALVIAPTSVCSNWLAEAARFAPSLQVRLYGGGAQEGAADDADDASDDGAHAQGAAEAQAQPERDAADTARLAARRRQVRALGPGHVLVCSYGLLQLDADILVEREWHTAVLDEAQAIKNAATRRAKAAARIDTGFPVALTGTPIENRLGELWSIMSFANPGLLGSAEQFNKRFAAPIERGGDVHAARRLRRLVAPFLLRRTKNEVLTDLPPRTEIVHDVVPGKRERALLEVLRGQAEESVNQVIAAGNAPTEGRLQMHILAALMRLRRAACDPRLVAPELGLVGAKVQEFERLALELVAGRHKALVFSQFTDFLALLRERLDAAGLRYQYLDGSTPAPERAKRIAAFQGGSGDFFLISLKAGGFGLNLTVADYVIIADPWWNPAVEDQASGRAHRIGQQRPVTVYRLVTKGSIEDRIVRLHRSKRDLAEGILGGQDGGAGVDAAQLLALLRGEADDDGDA